MKFVKDGLKRGVAILALSLLVVSSLSAPQVRAHELKNSNGISVIFHIEPDDNPVAGEPTVLNMLFSDEAGGFKLSNYDLKVELKQEEKLLKSYTVAPAFFGAAREGDSTITFPSVGAYDINLIGTAKDKTAKDFKLDYDIKVRNAGATAKSNNNAKTIILLSALGIIVFAAISARAVMSGGKYSAKKPMKKTKKDA